MTTLKRLFQTGCLLLICFLLFHQCASTSIALKPATIIQRDVFTCKGLSADNRWVGITDEFLPEQDSRIVVVAVLSDQDRRRIVNFELINPMDNVAVSETLHYPSENPLGIYYSIPRLLKLGGEGKWKATVFVDGLAIGESEFYLGKKPADEEKTAGPRYFVVGEETEDASGSLDANAIQEDRFSSYIRDVTSSLSIPIPPDETSEPSHPGIQRSNGLNRNE